MEVGGSGLNWGLEGFECNWDRPGGGGGGGGGGVIRLNEDKANRFIVTGSFYI